MTSKLSDEQKTLLQLRIDEDTKDFKFRVSNRRTLAEIQATSDRIFFAAEAQGDISPEQRASNRVVFAQRRGDEGSIFGRIVEPGEIREVGQSIHFVGKWRFEVLGETPARPWEDYPRSLALQESISIEEVRRRGLEWTRR
jgi:hypothetical protein